MLDPIEGITAESRGARLPCGDAIQPGRAAERRTDAGEPTSQAAPARAATEDLSVELGGLPVLRGITPVGASRARRSPCSAATGPASPPWSARLLGLVPAQRGHGPAVRRAPAPASAHWSPDRLRPAALDRRRSAGAKVREVVASGRLARRRPFVPGRAATTGARSRERPGRWSALADRAGADAGRSVRRPAAAGADRPRAGRRAGAAGPGRADGRGRPGAPAGAGRAADLDRLVRPGIAVLVVLHEVGPLAPLIDRVDPAARRPGRATTDGSATRPHTAHEHGHAHDRPGIADRPTGGSASRLDGAADPMIELLGYPFMQRALLAALLTGLIAPAIGTYIVQRRLSLLGDGLGHVAIAGVGLALLTGQAPMPVAVAVCVAGAVVGRAAAPAGQGHRRRRAGHPVLRRPGGRGADVRHRRRRAPGPCRSTCSAR